MDARGGEGGGFCQGRLRFWKTAVGFGLRLGLGLGLGFGIGRGVMMMMMV